MTPPTAMSASAPLGTCPSGVADADLGMDGGHRTGRHGKRPTTADNAPASMQVPNVHPNTY